MKSKKYSGFSLVLLLAGFVMFTVVIAGSYIVSNKAEDNTQEASNLAVDDSQDTLSDDRDNIQNDNTYKLHGKLVAYSINNNGSYPDPTAEGWQKLINDSSSDSQIDPFSEKPYIFTDSEPEFGEIEYRFPASCDDARKDFVPANSSRSYAFRLRYSDGVSCSHSL